MRNSFSLFFLGCCFCLAATAATDNVTSSSTGPTDKAALESALSACASYAGKDGSGQPNMQAMDSCMSDKGFKKPNGPPSGQGGQPPPGLRSK